MASAICSLGHGGLLSACGWLTPFPFLKAGEVSFFLHNTKLLTQTKENVSLQAFATYFKDLFSFLCTYNT